MIVSMLPPFTKILFSPLSLLLW